jgi:hypothetical protein
MLCRVVPIACAVLLACGCDYSVLSTRAGDHVTYHWDADERQLCGGTVPYADRVVDVMLAEYGYSATTDGPSIEYFWSIDGIELDICGSVLQCVIATPSLRARWATSVFAPTAIDTHELAHAAIQYRHHGLPSFVGEGLATRWGSTVLGGPVSTPTPFVLSESDLRARINERQIDIRDYNQANAWWVALESRFGGKAMGEFAAAIGMFASDKDVDDALRTVLGITLAESVTIAATHPPQYFDPIDCGVSGLPTYRWTGAALSFDRSDAECKDDLVDWNSRVAWPFVLEVPEATDVEIRVEGDDSNSQALRLMSCRGETGDQTPPIISVFDSGTYVLHGRYIGSLLGDFRSKGAVSLPRATIEVVTP